MTYVPSPLNASLVRRKSVIRLVLLLAAATFKELLEITIFGEWLFYMIAASTVFVFRHREPNAERPFKTWGYPVVPALFVIAASILLYRTFMENVHNSMIGSGIILAGVPVFYYFAAKRGEANPK